MPAVHPRTCGERIAYKLPVPKWIGSSPHLRGTSILKFSISQISRFIPAPAGNVLCSSNQKIQVTVHPRTCGERNFISIIDTRSDGSSPHLRGTFHAWHWLHQINRFIPAPAGNVCIKPSAAKTCAVHPRTCGERQ